MQANRVNQKQQLTLAAKRKDPSRHTQEKKQRTYRQRRFNIWPWIISSIMQTESIVSDI